MRYNSFGREFSGLGDDVSLEDAPLRQCIDFALMTLFLGLYQGNTQLIVQVKNEFVEL